MKVRCSKILNAPLKYNIFVHLWTTTLIISGQADSSIAFYETMFNEN